MVEVPQTSQAHQKAPPHPLRWGFRFCRSSSRRREPAKPLLNRFSQALPALLDRCSGLPNFLPGLAPLNPEESFRDRQRMTTMIDEKLARLRTHHNNIARYQRLLKTELSDLERQFIERRLSEEHSDFERLTESAFPISLNDPPTPAEQSTAHDAA